MRPLLHITHSCNIPWNSQHLRNQLNVEVIKTRTFFCRKTLKNRKIPSFILTVTLNCWCAQFNGCVDNDNAHVWPNHKSLCERPRPQHTDHTDQRTIWYDNIPVNLDSSGHSIRPGVTTVIYYWKTINFHQVYTASLLSQNITSNKTCTN